MDQQDVKIPGTAPWQNNAAYNTYWTYNQSTKATFYAVVSPRYYHFMVQYVQHWLYWYDGWCPYFHNSENGIFSTHLATSIINRLADKVSGGQLMFKNSGKELKPGETNKALEFISTQWAQQADFARVRNLAIRYAAAAGTALLKANKDKKGIWAEALRFDSFVPEVDFRGNVVRVTCYLQQYTDMAKSNKNGTSDSYYLVEERYFGDISQGRVTLRNRPLVKYSVKKATAVVGASTDVPPMRGESVEFSRLPKQVRNSILKNYNVLRFDVPHLLPFKDWLGVELVRWTDTVSDIPQLPFGESLLAQCISYLMTYDYYYSAFATDMYTGRARVLIPKQMENPKKDKTSNYNTGFDSYLYQQYPSTANVAINGEPEKPIPLQFDLRSTDWKTIRDTIIENIALNIGVNTSTLASFLSDSGAKTATEVSTDENETAGFINNQRSIIEKPFNRFLKHVTEYYGHSDTVELRWSAAGLTNRKTLTDILCAAKNANIISTRKAVEMFNYDDDTAQVEEELSRVQKEESNRQAQFDPFGGFGGAGDLPK